MNDPTEAQIEAIWPEYEIKDLNLKLKFGGKPEFVSKALADGSSDLKEAKRLGSVRVSWVKRCTVSKKPPRNQAPPSARRIKHVAPKKSVPAPAPVDEDAIAEKVAAKLSRNLDDRDNKLRQEIKDMIAKGGKVDAAELAALLSESLADKMPTQQVVVQKGSSDEKRSAVDDAPMFIPSNIVPSDAKSNIRAKEETGDSSHSDASRDKLAAMRKRKKNEES